MQAASIGAASELIAAADLLRRGFLVFRSLTYTGCCDLMILRGREAWRVEVRTANRWKARDGEPGPWFAHDLKSFDILAYVFPDGCIAYRPRLSAIVGADMGPEDGEQTSDITEVG